MDTNLETRGLRRKTEWQSGKGGNTGCGGAVIKHFPHPLAFEGFWETVPAIFAPLISSMRINGPQLGLSHNCSPCSSFITADGYCSLNNRRLLRHLLRLSNSYYTTITLVFSPRLGFSDFSVNGSRTGCLLGWSFTILLLWTLAPHDYVIYC